MFLLLEKCLDKLFSYYGLLFLFRKEEYYLR